MFRFLRTKGEGGTNTFEVLHLPVQIHQNASKHLKADVSLAARDCMLKGKVVFIILRMSQSCDWLAHYKKKRLKTWYVN